MGSQSGTDTVDVIVVGFGGAGIAAAITAHDAGAEVLVLEKMPPEQAGGNTRVSGQIWYSANDAALAKEYLRGLSYDIPIDDDIAEAWAQEICRNTEWLTARAAEAQGTIDVDPLDPWGQGTEYTQLTYGDMVRGAMHWETDLTDEFPQFNNKGGSDYIYFGPSQGYSRLWLRIKAALETRDVEIRYATPAIALLTDDAGRVTGVLARGPEGDRELHARRGVILANGGFENNQEMIRTYLGMPYATPWGTPANTGDGIRMAQALGADLRNMYQHMPFFGIRIPGRETGEFAQPGGPSYINVRKDGRRFGDETLLYTHGKSMLGGKLEFYPHSAMWTIFDEDVRLAGPLSMSHADYPLGWLKRIDRYVWSEDNSAEIDKGWIARADSIRELAEQLGVDPDGLEDEVAQYNALAERGEDPRFGRRSEAMAPILRPPFYGYEWGNLLINTMGGLRKDGQARVRHVEGHVIEGLYCAGEIASTYSWALSGGQSLGDALTFGRIAGRSAAAGEPVGDRTVAAAAG